MADFYYSGQNYTNIQKIKMPEPDNAGGVVPFYSMDGSLDWMGPDAELIGQIYANDMTLADTDFVGWAASTTAKTIKATITVAPTYTASQTTVYSYIVEWLTDINVAYDGTEDNKARLERYFGVQYQDIHRRPYGFVNFESMTDSYNYCTTLLSGGTYTIYRNTSGTETWTSGLSYGLYSSLTAASFSSTTSTSPTLTFKTPVLSARCSTTYWKVANAGKVDVSKTTIRIRANLYRRPAKFSNMRNMYRVGVNLYDNPIPAIPTS